MAADRRKMFRLVRRFLPTSDGLLHETRNLLFWAQLCCTLLTDSKFALPTDEKIKMGAAYGFGIKAGVAHKFKHVAAH